jgi:hypothetical protein
MGRSRWFFLGATLIFLGGWLEQPSVLAAPLLPSAPTKASPPALDNALDSSPPEAATGMEQVTSISQLTDVKPTDWAFQALQSLVDRYGCIVGYPDKTFRGDRSLSRYEFAAGLNACLNRVRELIGTSTNSLARRQDLDTLKRLVDEFSRELAVLRGRVDELDRQVGLLEERQFSTTTKLNGELIVYAADAFGKVAGDVNNFTRSYRLRLNFDTSFNGRDRFRTRLQASNLNLLSAGDPNITNFSGGGFGAPQRLASTFPNAFSDETRLLPSFASADKNNSAVRIEFLGYDLPLGDRLTVHVHAGQTDPSYFGADPISPFTDSATGAISYFANSNPVYASVANQAGFGLDYRLSDWLAIAAGYAGQGRDVIGASNRPDSSSGIFRGGYSAFGQITAYLGNLTAGFLYLNTYAPQGGLELLSGSNAAKISTGGFSSPTDDRVSSNRYGFIANYRINDGFQVGGWVGFINAQVLGRDASGLPTGNRGDVKVWNYAVTLSFPDLLIQGNQAGFVFGMQPRVTDTSNARVAAAIGLPNGERRDRDVGFHIEAFYRIQLNDNISITPGIFWLTAPNHDARNPDAFIGVLRTSFTF